MKFAKKTSSLAPYIDDHYWIQSIVILVIIQLFFSIKINAQSGTLTFSGANTVNLGTMLYDNRTYSTDISTVEIKVFNARSEADAVSRTSTGSLVLVASPDLISTYPAVFSNNSTSGTLVFDYNNPNRPKYIVLASTNGAEFRFSSVYIVEPDVWIKPPQIKFEGFRNGTTTGYVILALNQDNGEYEKTFDVSYFPVSIFGNVDEIRISRGYTDEFTGNLDGFNNFVFSAPAVSYVNVSTTSLGIGAAENSSASFNISSNTSWTVSSDQPWLSATPTSGNNNSAVTITAQANPSTTIPRTASLTVTGGNTITITQPAANATLSVSAATLNVAAAANATATFNITSNVGWSVSKDQAWLTVSPSNGSNNGTVTVTAQANPNAATRTATISISGAGIPETITVTQAAASPALSVSSNSVGMGNAANNTANFQIISNTAWDISSNQSWLTISPPSATGSAWITLTATSSNPDVNKRFATLTVSASGVSSQTIVVEQEGAATIFSVSPSAINVSSSSGSTSFNVTSNIAWTTLVDQSWASISPTSDTGNTTVNVNFQANTLTTERTCIITVNGNGDKKYVQIIQSGVEKTLSVSANTLNIGEFANNFVSFNVTGNTFWDVSCNEPWLSISPAGGMNNVSVMITANENNPFGFSRNATITVFADGLPDKTITVTQAASAPILSVSNETLDIACGNNSTSVFDITSNTNWTVESNQIWLTASDITGAGNKTITLTALENSLTSTRTCTVTLKASGVVNKTVTVTQAAGTPTGTENLQAVSFRVWTTPGQLHIANVSSNSEINVYAISGTTVYSTRSQSESTIIPLSKGVYVVKIANERAKVTVR